MNKLKILILDDSDFDIKLIKHTIEKNFDNAIIEAAKNRKDFIKKLTQFKPSIVISDYNLPDFDGLSALKITHEMYRDLPFIIVTGSVSEEFGINCIKYGAYDYILKKHLKKIPVAIEEALEKYELIIQHRKAYEELRENEKKFRLLAENAQDLIYRYEIVPKREFTYVSPSATKITGYTPEDHYADPDLGFKIVHPDDRYILEKVAKGEIKPGEPITLRWIKKDGTVIWTEQRNIPIYDANGNLIAIEGIARDITEGKRLAEKLKENEFRFRMVSSLITDYAYSFIVDENKGLKGEWISESFSKIFGYTLQEIEAQGGFITVFHPDDRNRVLNHAQNVASGNPEKMEVRMITKSGEVRWVRDYAVPIFDENNKRVIKIFGVAEDITENKKLEEIIKQREEHWEKLAESTTTAIFVYQGEYFVYVNHAAEIITEYSREELSKIKFYDLVHPEFRDLVKERGLRRQKGEPIPQNYQFKIITKSGKEKWLDFTGILINRFGKSAGLGAAYDITSHKKAIDELEIITERYRNLFEFSPVGILLEDEYGTIIDVNKEYERITGYSKEELIGKNIRILANTANFDLVEKNIKRILSGEVLNHTVKSVKKNGSKIYLHLVETVVVLPNGRKGILSICQDMTEKVFLENKLLESEKKFRTIFETANEGICIVDTDENITDVNPKFCLMLGYSREEIVNQNFDELFVHPEEKDDAVLQKVKRQNGQSGIFERRLITRDGSVIWMKVAATGILDEKGEFKGSFAFFTDITEQKTLQEKLQKSEEQFRLIWESSQDGMRLTDEKGRIVMVNPAYCRLVGIKREELIGKTIADVYITKRKREILEKHIQRFISNNIKSHLESEMTLRDGRKIWLDVSNTFIEIRGKKYLLGIFRDITEKKKLQQEIIDSEKQFRNIWEKSNDVMFVLDTDGIVRLVNPAFCQLVGINEKDILLKPISDILEENKKQQYISQFNEKYFNLNTINNRIEGEVTIKSGRLIYFDATISKMNLQGEELYLIISRDITERKKLIDELIRAKEEAEEANRLKSGFISMMSHEIRTPLNVILGFTNVIKEIYFTKQEDEEIPKYFEAIDKAGKRLLSTITQILDISRIESGEYELYPREFNLNEKVINTIEQLKVLANEKNIVFDVALDKKQPKIFCDEYCLDGILINLINNAIKFSHKNSKIEISTIVKTDTVVFKIRDYGIGMSEEYQKHLFQAFSQENVGYSRPYEGTGLGLALTKRFVELVKGGIKFWSKKGEGTQFDIIFPLHK